MRTLARLVVALLAIFGALVVVVGWTPLSNVLARPLVVSAPPARADAIVVLGGGLHRDGSLSDSSLRRLASAVKLYRGGWAPVIVLSAGDPEHIGLSEAAGMRREALVFDVPATAMLLEERSTRTSEEGVEVARIARQQGFRTLLLVTTPIHMRRSALVFRKLGLRVVPQPTDGGLEHTESAAERVRLAVDVAHEYIGLAYYRLRGWI